MLTMTKKITFSLLAVAVTVASLNLTVTSAEAGPRSFGGDKKVSEVGLGSGR